MKHIFILLLILAYSLHAGWREYYIESKCNLEKNTVSLIPSSVLEEYRNAVETECVLGNGNKIKMKLGLGSVYPYGQGGAIPDAWVSLWINEVKVKSKFPINCVGEGVCNFYFKAQNNDFETCSINPKSEYYKKYADTPKWAIMPAPNINTDFKCTKVQEKTLKTKKDKIEYPVGGKKLEVGDWKAYYEKNKTFCNQFIEHKHFQLPTNAIMLNTGNQAQYKYAGYYEKMKDADYDNDGSVDKAYALHSRTHYQDGDTYFFFTKENNISVLWPQIDEKLLAKNAKKIFPNKEIKMITPDTINGNASYFSDRYTYSEPFILNGITYFNINHHIHNYGEGRAILKLLPNNNIEHMCYFHRIIENY